MTRDQRDAIYACLADIANLADDRQDVDGIETETQPGDWLKVSEWAHQALAELPWEEE